MSIVIIKDVLFQIRSLKHTNPAGWLLHMLPRVLIVLAAHCEKSGGFSTLIYTETQTQERIQFF